jgi:tetratricopeptide (TPR) repeat protein
MRGRARFRPRHALYVVAALAGLSGVAQCPAGDAAGAEASPAACATSSPGPDEVRIAAALQRDPDSVDTRVKLANALSDRGCYNDAIRALEAGVELDPHSRILQDRLRSARSTLSEQGYFEGLGRAEESAKTQRNVLRCRNLSDLAACDQALAAAPGDRTLMIAKADALVRAGHPSDALPIYEKAASLDPADESLKARIGATESARAALVTRCQNEQGDAAINACDLGLRHGARDEFAIYKRKGTLLQAQDQPSRALDAYIAANLLDPSDRVVASAIAALTQSTGRQDALALAARSSALSLLNPSVRAGTVPTASAGAPHVDGARPRVPVVVATRAQAAVRAPSAVRAEPALRLEAPKLLSTTYSNAAPAGDSH